MNPELEILQFWEENSIFHKSVDQRPKAKRYIFYDGPPFATGLPHYGNMLGLISKDLFCRFWTMKGFRVERRWGWDCHGLPLEAIGEKDLGVSGKEAIELYGVEKFNNYCQSKVLTYAKDWKERVARLGKWIEFDNSYKTMDNTYIESVWWAFKTLYEKKHIYEGRKVLLFCPKSQTPISKFEIQMDNSYKTVTEKTATVAFKVKGTKNEYLVAWTTTPWTLLANVAIAINSELDYVKVLKEGKKYIMARSLVETVFEDRDGEEEVLPKELIGLEYERLYDLPVEDPSKKGWYVIDAGSEVNDEDGTGLVHMAPYGEFDYEMIKKFKLPFLTHLDDQGKMIFDLHDWQGLFFKKLDPKVLEDLDSRKILLKAQTYTHPYPYSPRYDVPLFYNPIPSWFIDVQSVKPRLLKLNEKIKWHPEHLQMGGFKHNIETAPDWNISRNRFWASSIPVWKSEDGKIVKIIGSIKELQECATSPVPDDINLHKHSIDHVQIKDPETGKILTRIPEVFDCWFESASMPFAAQHYPFENKDWFTLNFPSDFVSEYIGQVRAWFYVMHVLSTLLFDRIPFKHVVTTGNLLGADGNKMSKSKKNFPDPNLTIDKYGADALRFYLMASPLMRAEDTNFNEESIKDSYRKVIVLLRNVNRFYGMFASSTKIAKPTSSHVMDKWILVQLNTANNTISKSLEGYDTSSACHAISTFVDHLSTWYVRRSRDRFKSSDVKTKNAAVETLGYVLYHTSKLIAPIIPFIAEEIYLSLQKYDTSLEESVHLDLWEEMPENKDDSLIENMIKVRDVVTSALDAREKAKIGIRQPLGNLSIHGASLSDEFAQIIKDEINVKSTSFTSADKVSVELDTTITPELHQEGLAREFIRNCNNLRKKSNLTITDRICVYVDANQEVTAAINKYNTQIKSSIHADSIEFSIPDDLEAKEIPLKQTQIKVAFKQ